MQDDTEDDCEIVFGFKPHQKSKVRARLRELLKTYHKLEDRRDVARLHPDSQGPRYLITGGMDGGDHPTDAYELLDQLGTFPEIYGLLLKWANEDITKGKA